MRLPTVGNTRPQTWRICVDADLVRCAELVEAAARLHDDLADAAVIMARSHRALAVLSRDIASFLRGGGLSEPLDLRHGGLGLIKSEEVLSVDAE